VIILDIPAITTFPDQMYIMADTVNGYSDNTADSTNIIAILRIRELVPYINAGMLNFTVIYSCM